MAKFSKISLFATAALILSPMAAVADFGGHGASSDQDAVVDARNNVVVNSFNNCVLTKWKGGKSCVPAIGSEELTVYFGFDSSRLTAAAITKLDNLIAKVGDSIESIDIVGFADKIGSSSYNEALSLRRAKAVSAYLKTKGINTGNISLQGLGETSSKSSCEGTRGNELKACLWRDRRVELRLNYK